MSISRLQRRRGRRADGAKARPPGPAAAFVLPSTVSRDALLDGGSDRRFRALVHDLLTIATRMETVREHHGRRMGISGPQYSVLMAVAHQQGDRGASVGTVAQALHVSSAFVAAETGKLARRGLLLKQPNPRDRRSVLLSLAPAGRLAIDYSSAEIRAINDMFFGELDKARFDVVCAAAAALVAGSRKAVRYLLAVDEDTRAALRPAG
jgi:DNA-binding MarR family transcriptional regulator